MTTDLTALVRAVAEQLGDGWGPGPSPSHDSRALVHPDGRALRMVITSNDRSRLLISGIYPNGRRPRAAQRITVGTGRSATAITREITRRLLPDYTRMYGEVRTQLADEQRRGRKRAEQAARLAACLPGGCTVNSYRGHPDDVACGDHATIFVRDDTSSIELTLVPHPVAEEVASTYRAALQRHRAGAPASGATRAS